MDESEGVVHVDHERSPLTPNLIFSHDEEDGIEIMDVVEIPEILFTILLFCDLDEIGNVMRTSRRMYEVATDDRLWRNICSRDNIGRELFSMSGVPVSLNIVESVYDDNTEGIFDVVREELENARDRVGRRLSRVERVYWEERRRNLFEVPLFLIILAIFCPSIANILSFKYLFLEEREWDLCTEEPNDYDHTNRSEIFSDGRCIHLKQIYRQRPEGREDENQNLEDENPRMDNRGLLRLSPYYCVCPCNPQLLEFLVHFGCSIISQISCCCCIGTFYTILSIWGSSDLHSTIGRRKWEGTEKGSFEKFLYEVHLFLPLCISPLHFLCFIFCCFSLPFFCCGFFCSFILLYVPLIICSGGRYLEWVVERYQRRGVFGRGIGMKNIFEVLDCVDVLRWCPFSFVILWMRFARRYFGDDYYCRYTTNDPTEFSFHAW